jgi:hypothetical protein
LGGGGKNNCYRITRFSLQARYVCIGELHKRKFDIKDWGVPFQDFILYGTPLLAKLDASTFEIKLNQPAVKL